MKDDALPEMLKLGTFNGEYQEWIQQLTFSEDGEGFSKKNWIKTGVFLNSFTISFDYHFLKKFEHICPYSFKPVATERVVTA